MLWEEAMSIPSGAEAEGNAILLRKTLILLTFYNTEEDTQPL
jgi:hypothetical protein